MFYNFTMLRSPRLSVARRVQTSGAGNIVIQRAYVQTSVRLGRNAGFIVHMAHQHRTKVLHVFGHLDGKVNLLVKRLTRIVTMIKVIFSLSCMHVQCHVQILCLIWACHLHYGLSLHKREACLSSLWICWTCSSSSRLFHIRTENWWHCCWCDFLHCQKDKHICYFTGGYLVESRDNFGSKFRFWVGRHLRRYNLIIIFVSIAQILRS